MTLLRVFCRGSHDDVASALSGRAELVDTPPADVALLVLDGQQDRADGGIEALRREAGAPVVAVIGSLPVPRQARMLAATADGIVERATLSRALLPAIDAVRSGLAVVPAVMYQALERPPLSNREKQILAMVVLGFSNAEIAGKLVVTESTVKNHLSSAFAKLGVRSRNAATSLLLDPATGLGLGVLQLSGATEP